MSKHNTTEVSISKTEASVAWGLMLNAASLYRVRIVGNKIVGDFRQMKLLIEESLMQIVHRDALNISELVALMKLEKLAASL